LKGMIVNGFEAKMRDDSTQHSTNRF